LEEKMNFMAKNWSDEIYYSSAYWAGRMIDMPDSRIAWDIAKEIAKELQSIRDQLAAKEKELIDLQFIAGNYPNVLNEQDRKIYAANEIIKKLLTIIENSPLQEDCVAGFDEVKFCYFRNGDGNKCLRCLDKSVIDKAKNLLK
jgi:hypothetical protein